jgi:hypothetical protein
MAFLSLKNGKIMVKGKIFKKIQVYKFLEEGSTWFSYFHESVILSLSKNLKLPVIIKEAGAC